MIWYLLTGIEFSSDGSGRQTFIKIWARQLNTNGETIHSTVEKHRIHNIKKRKKNKINIKGILTF